MTKSISKKLKNRKQKIKNRTRRRNWDDQNRPMFSGSNIHYEFDGRHKGISYGGIGVIHTLAEQTGLIDEIDKRLDLLKRHLPTMNQTMSSTSPTTFLQGAVASRISNY